MEHNTPKPTGTRHYIYLYDCLQDMPAAAQDKWLNYIYNTPQEFAGFKWGGPDIGALSALYEQKAHDMYRKGYPLGQILTTIKKLEHQRKHAKADLIKELIAKTAPNKPSQPFSVKKPIQTKPIFPAKPNKKRKILIPILSILLITLLISGTVVGHKLYTIHQEREYHLYEHAKAELVAEKYKKAINAYNKAVEKENNKTSSWIAIDVSNTLIYNNSVGNDWIIDNYVNGELIFYSGRIYIDFGSPITVKTYIEEQDRIPDISSGQATVHPSKEALIRGCTLRQKIYVEEGNGRYTGNTALWETTYTFQAIMDYPQKPDRAKIKPTDEEIKARVEILRKQNK